MVTKSFLLRVLVKGLLLFALVILLSGLLPAMPLGRISAYNGLFPGRPRFPFGETPREAYNFSLFNLDAMIASHEITQAKPPDEFRVIVLGDSSIWGTLLPPEQTLAGQLNALKIPAPDGRKMRFYNLGYPTLSLFKDLMILNRAKQYQPDLVIWPVTLEAFPVDKQLSVPLVENSPEEALRILRSTNLDFDSALLHPKSFWQRTLIGQRKNLADVFRLQWYGVLWAATGIDQVYPTEYPHAQVDLEADPTFHGKQVLAESDLAFQALDAGAKMLKDVPLLVINEPILISTGKNSEIRYNFYYPRAAYDAYRTWMQQRAGNAPYFYRDAWDLIPVGDFTNSAIHLNADGVSRLAGWIAGQLQTIALNCSRMPENELAYQNIFTGGTLTMPSDTMQEISAYIAKEILKQPGRSLAGDTVLISSGLVDSFNLVDLAMFIEERFGVKIDDTELTADTFDTLDQLSELVDSRRING